LLSDYKRLLAELCERIGGRDVEVSFDTALAAFATAKQAALAAVAAQRPVAAHTRPTGPGPAISVALHSGEAGLGWVGPAASRCSELCDTAEGKQIFMSQATASLLDDEDLGALRCETSACARPDGLGKRARVRARRSEHSVPEWPDRP
jgi:class 3 adenylate cyclase